MRPWRYGPRSGPRSSREAEARRVPESAGIPKSAAQEMCALIALQEPAIPIAFPPRGPTAGCQGSATRLERPRALKEFVARPSAGPSESIPDSIPDPVSERSPHDVPAVLHRSVLPREVLELLSLRPGDLCVDATLGNGGHAEEALRALAPGGLLLGLDVDPEALAGARKRLEPLAAELHVQLELEQANFRELAGVLSARAPGRAPRGILADLGVSSMQLDRPARGFSFRYDAPLDMRMDPRLPETGADLLRELPEEALADLIYTLGEERASRRIARRIVAARDCGAPIATTGQLERLVRSALHVRGHRRIHPATRTFMALRMAVNRELEALEAFLESAPECLAQGGVLAILAFHSGEDRMVKRKFKALASTGRFQGMRKSAVRPQEDEARANPRSRSARLRGLQRL